tara:strand:+ start:79 stop:423 length:345 start_codon:yes stop_codon:yes gene_type:complete
MSKQTAVAHLVKFDTILGELKTTGSQDLITVNAINQDKEMKKQTAVEFLVEEFSSILEKLNFTAVQGLLLKDALEQAFKMEKDQQEMAFNEALDEYSDCSFEEYYNETYKKAEK